MLIFDPVNTPKVVNNRSDDPNHTFFSHSFFIYKKLKIKIFQFLKLRKKLKFFRVDWVLKNLCMVHLLQLFSDGRTFSRLQNMILRVLSRNSLRNTYFWSIPIDFIDGFEIRIFEIVHRFEIISFISKN